MTDPDRGEDVSLLLTGAPGPDAGSDAFASPVGLAMAGKRDLPVPDADIYPGLEDAALMKEVYRAWMTGGGISLREAAEACGAAPETAVYWAERGDWMLQKRRMFKVQAQEAALGLEKMRAEKRTEECAKQIELAQALRGKAAGLLDNPAFTVFNKRTGEEVVVESLTPQDLKFIADSAKAGSDIMARFLGVAEAKPGNEQAAAGEIEEEKKTAAPLVVVIKGGGLPPVREKENVISV